MKEKEGVALKLTAVAAAAAAAALHSMKMDGSLYTVNAFSFAYIIRVIHHAF